MYPRTITWPLFLSGLFMLGFGAIIGITVYNEVENTLQAINNWVSTIDVHALHRLQPYPDATIVLLAYNYSTMLTVNVSGRCTCRRKYDHLNKDDMQPEDTICQLQALEATGRVGKPDMFGLFMEAPVLWGRGEMVKVMCPDLSYDVMFMVAISNLSLHETVSSIVNMDADKSVEQMMKVFYGSELPWLNTNGVNQVRLSRKEDYVYDKLQSVQIFPHVSTVQYGRPGPTRINFNWMDGKIERYRKYQTGSYWSIVTLSATVLLAVERGYAFSKRVKSYRCKQRSTLRGDTTRESTLTSVVSVSSPVDVKNMF